MKSLHLVPFQARRAGLALVLVAFAPALLLASDPVKAASPTADKIADVRPDDPAANKAEFKATALTSIDAELSHLEKLLEAAPTPEAKDDAKAHFAALKDRRDELKSEFTRSRYEAFKATLKEECDKASAWVTSQRATTTTVVATSH